MPWRTPWRTGSRWRWWRRSSPGSAAPSSNCGVSSPADPTPRRRCGRASRPARPRAGLPARADGQTRNCARRSRRPARARRRLTLPPAPARRRRTEPQGRTPQLLRMASTQVRQIRPVSSTSRSRVRRRAQVPNTRLGSARPSAAGSARLAPPTPEAVADARAARARRMGGSARAAPRPVSRTRAPGIRSSPHVLPRRVSSEAAMSTTIG